MSAKICPVCGVSLTAPEEFADLWGLDPDATPYDESQIIDLYPADSLSLQATTPIRQIRDDPGARAGRETPSTPDDPWSSRGARLAGTQIGTGQVAPKPVPVDPVVVEPVAYRRGPQGWVLGLVAFLIILAVALFFAWSVGKPYLSDRVASGVADGLASDTAAIDALPVRSSGSLVVSADALNRALAAGAGFDSISEPVVAITRDGATVSFKLYGVTSHLSSGLEVDSGRIVLSDPNFSGPASRLLSADELAAEIESTIASVLDRFKRRPTAIRFRDGSVVISTEPA